MVERILIFDIETSPIEAYVWGLFDVNVSLDQIKTDWSILAWSAKWLGDPASKIMYMDVRDAKSPGDDRRIVQALVELLEQADGIITQNGDAFDVKKLNTRAILNGLPPTKLCKSTDILKECRKVFKFTSNKLAYTTGVLNTRYKKLTHRKYPGNLLWKAVMAGDIQAWAEMEKYCKHDVLSTEEAYTKIRKWIKDPAVYGKEKCRRCRLIGFRSEGIRVTGKESYRRLICKYCGLPRKGKV